MEKLNVGSVGGGGNSDGEVIHIRNDKGPRNIHMKGGDIYHKQKGGDRGALGHPN